MQHNLQQTMSLLARTPVAFNALLRDLPEAWTHHNEGENTWNAFEVVGHLIDCERTNWIPRAKIILNSKARTSRSRLLIAADTFERRRASRLPVAGRICPTADRKPGRAARMESAAGRSRKARTASCLRSGPVCPELLATWAAHDLGHLHQVSRIMAHQYRETVGPWSKYLGVLQCTGHSANG